MLCGRALLSSALEQDGSLSENETACATSMKSFFSFQLISAASGALNSCMVAFKMFLGSFYFIFLVEGTNVL